MNIMTEYSTIYNDVIIYFIILFIVQTVVRATFVQLLDANLARLACQQVEPTLQLHAVVGTPDVSDAFCISSHIYISFVIRFAKRFF